MALPPGLQPKTIVSLIEEEITRQPSHIEPRVLPIGGQLILASQAKTGKSHIMFELGRAMASADVPFGAPNLFCPRACKVLMCEQELGKESLKERVARVYTYEEIKRQGFMANNFVYVSKQPELRIDTLAGLRILYELINEVQPDVLMLDPLGRFHQIDENDNQKVSEMWSNIDKIQKAYPQMSFVTSMHMSKPPDIRSGIDPLDPYRIRGASKFFDNADSIITSMRTHDLATKPHKSWSVTCRYTLRHGESPDDQILHINERDDLRVRYYKTCGADGPVMLTQLPPKKEKGEPPVQLGFAQGNY